MFVKMLSRCVKSTVKLKKYSALILRNLSSLQNDVVNKVFVDQNGLRKSKPDLKDFIQKSFKGPQNEEYISEHIPYVDQESLTVDGLRVYFEVYGCQMNVNDTEVVWAILQKAGYTKVDDEVEADIILIVTCAIREGAENKIWAKLKDYAVLKRIKRETVPLKIGILGCMAERLKEKIIEKEKIVDLVAGPDSYKDLPRLLALTRSNQKAVNILLSLDETYADVMPVRLNQDSVTSYISIMRGCDNMCSYCIVPFTRGKERSRSIDSILDEVRYLSDRGIKEITLLGQNVNSYRYIPTDVIHKESSETKLARGFKTVYKLKKGGIRFADLLDKVSLVDPEIRIRFTSPHPKDFPDEVLQVIKERNNICKCLHLPAQSGNNEILERMRRGYTREAYLELVERIRQILPNVALSSDFIAGFCGETEEQFEDTVSLLSLVNYHVAYLFAYSMREKTTAYRRYEDNVPKQVKNQRVTVLSKVFRKLADQLNQKEMDKTLLILIEGNTRRSDKDLYGKTDAGIKVIIPKIDVAESSTSSVKRQMKPGDYVSVKITATNSQILKGIPLYHTSLREYYSNNVEETTINSIHSSVAVV